MEPAGPHRLDLGRVRLNRKELDLLARYFLHVFQKALPNLGVNRRVFYRCIGKDQWIRIHLLSRVARRVGDHVAICVLETRAKLKLSRRGCRKSWGDNADENHHNWRQLMKHKAFSLSERVVSPP